MRIVLPVLVLFTMTATPAADPIPAVVAFEQVWNPFVRKLAGCPLEGVLVSPKQCNLTLSSWDYHLFLRSRKAAAKLFDLKEAP